MIKGKKILASLAMFFLVFSFVGVKAFAEGENVVELKASFGWDGLIKEAASVPLITEIKNNGDEALKGTVEVLVPNPTGGKDSYTQNVEIAGKETKKIYIPINKGNGDSKIKIKLTLNESLVEEKELIIPQSATLDWGSLVVGVFTDDIKALDYFNEIKSINQGEAIHLNKVKLAPLSMDVFDYNIKNLQSIDVILLNNFDSSKLSQNARTNLVTWVENGGIILLGGTENTINNFPKEILNLGVSGFSNKWVQIADGLGLTLKLGNVSGDGLLEGVKYGKNILSKRIDRKSGSIIVTSFDLGQKSLNDFEGKSDLIINMLKKDLERLQMKGFGGGSYPFELDAPLNSIPLQNEFPLKNIGIVLGMFILLTSFGGYFILKKIDKRELLWILIPVFSVAFTLVIANISKSTSIKEKVQIGLNAVSIDKDGNGKVESYLSIGNKFKSDLEINEPAGVKIEYIENPYKNQGVMMMGGGNSDDNIKSKTIYDGNKTTYSFSEVGALELKQFKLSGKEGKFKKVDGSVKFNEYAINGKVTNNMDKDIIDSYLICSGKVWEIGSLKRGESFDFKEKAADYNGNLREYIGNKMNKVFEAVYSGGTIEDKEKYKDIARTVALLNIGAKGAEGKTPYIISITDEDIDYGLTLNSDDVMKFSKTVYLNPITLDMSADGGEKIYPPGYLEGTVSKKDDAVFVEPGFNVAYGKGDVTMDYTFEENFEVKEVKFFNPTPSLDENSKFGARFVKFSGKAQIFNPKTEKFENLNFNYDGVTNIENLKTYIKDGVLRLKFSFDGNESGAKVPEISVRGKVKNVRN